MVKNLADELTDILDWNENPGLGEKEVEQARAGLFIFCRGLVCGLRFGQQVTGNTPISVNGELLNKFKPDRDDAEAKRRMEEKAEARRCLEEKRRQRENGQSRPADANCLWPVDEKVQEAVDNLHDAGRL